MRYLILKPRHLHFDPRHDLIKSAEHLHELVTPIADCATEAEAVSCVRRAYPGAIGMPMSVRIGTGATVLLGFVEDPSRPIDPDEDLPFVVLVQPVSQSPSDRKDIERAVEGRVQLFDRVLWRLKPVQPALYRTRQIEWRTSELDAPVFLDARVGYDNGHLVIYVEVGDQSMSIGFREMGLELVERDDLKAVTGHATTPMLDRIG